MGFFHRHHSGAHLRANAGTPERTVHNYNAYACKIGATGANCNRVCPPNIHAAADLADGARIFLLSHRGNWFQQLDCHRYQPDRLHLPRAGSTLGNSILDRPDAEPHRGWTDTQTRRAERESTALPLYHRRMPVLPAGRHLPRSTADQFQRQRVRGLLLRADIPRLDGYWSALVYQCPRHSFGHDAFQLWHLRHDLPRHDGPARPRDWFQMGDDSTSACMPGHPRAFHTGDYQPAPRIAIAAPGTYNRNDIAPIKT